MSKKTVILATLLLLSNLCWASETRLVVNFIVSSLRSGDIEKYSDNFAPDGAFDRLYNNGICYTKAEYSFAQTSGPATVATLGSGTYPAMHGVIGTNWFDYATTKKIELLEDENHRNLEYDYNKAGFSPNRLIAQTFSEALLTQKSGSKSLTISFDPVVAISLAGSSDNVFWLDKNSSRWATSTAYQKVMPTWVDRYNTQNQTATNNNTKEWVLTKNIAKYKNKRINILDPKRIKSSDVIVGKTVQPIDLTKSYNKLSYTPLGITAILDFAKVAIANLDFGKDSTVDVVNIHITPTGSITAAYGRESIETEEMWYLLDEQLAGFISFITAQVRRGEVLFTFTSDSGSAPSYDVTTEKSAHYGRINAKQIEVILNGFLNARYGADDWILGYFNNSIYLNHETIYKKNLTLEEVQNEVASFMMHFQGVAYALTATALRSSGFASGYGRSIQNSFYPRRSGDVAIALLPGWVEPTEAHHRTAPGSLYHYDRQVPLLFYNSKITPQKITQTVDLNRYAPTISHILGIDAPLFSEEEALIEVVNSTK